MSGKKQTAVEWLALYIKGITTLNCDEVISKAIALEKEQIIDAYVDGNHSEMRGGKFINPIAEQYYTSTYE